MQGRVNATGVDANVPISDKNLSSLSPSKMQTTNVNKTVRDLDRFLSHYLFKDLGMFLYKYSSTMILAGKIIRVYEKITLIEKAILITYTTQPYSRA